MLIWPLKLWSPKHAQNPLLIQRDQVLCKHEFKVNNRITKLKESRLNSISAGTYLIIIRYWILPTLDSSGSNLLMNPSGTFTPVFTPSPFALVGGKRGKNEDISSFIRVAIIWLVAGCSTFARCVCAEWSDLNL